MCLEVAVGSTVTFQSKEGDHRVCWLGSDEEPDDDLGPEITPECAYTVAFNKPGTFHFYDSHYTFLPKGYVVVKPAVEDDKENGGERWQGKAAAAGVPLCVDHSAAGDEDGALDSDGASSESFLDPEDLAYEEQLRAERERADQRGMRTLVCVKCVPWRSRLASK